MAEDDSELSDDFVEDEQEENAEGSTGIHAYFKKCW